MPLPTAPAEAGAEALAQAIRAAGDRVFFLSGAGISTDSGPTSGVLVERLKSVATS